MRDGVRTPGLTPATAAALATVLLLASTSQSLLAESIYYQKQEDGTIRLTNAPSSRGYHTYLVTGHYGGSGEQTSGLYAEPIRQAAKKFDVDPGLVRAVIAAESNFDPKAVSPRGAGGLMQLMPATATRFGVTDVFDPRQNIVGGVRYLRYLLDLFEGNLVLVLAAYNAGEGVVQSSGGVPNFRETREYVDRVLARYGQPAKGERASTPAKPAPRGMPAVSARKSIYKTVSVDGALVFSDSPIPKPIQD